MVHPVVFACALRTAEAIRTSGLCDDREAAGTAALMQMLATSREVIAQSRALLAELKAQTEIGSFSNSGEFA